MHGLEQTIYEVIECTCILAFVYFIINKNNHKKELEIANSQISFYKLKEDIVRENEELVLRIKHDIYTDLKVIRLLLNRKDFNAANRKIEEKIGKLETIDKVIETEIPELDFVVNSKLIEAKKSGIKFDVSINIPDELSIDCGDISTILTNMIDNAIESCHLIKSNSFIKLYIDSVHGNLFIKIKNSCIEREIPLEGNDPVTTKKDKQFHGYGIKIIRSIVDKYDGDLRMKCFENTFITEAILFL